MKTFFPKRIQKGSNVRVIAPSRSMAIISAENRKLANERLQKLGFNLSFGKHIEESDRFASSGIESRVEDLHEAFANKSVDAILTVIGGFNSNQLLNYIDWKLIKKNPKILCGYSDITVLSNAIYAKTGIVTYSGPHYSSFAEKLHFDYTVDYFEKCLMSNKPIELKPSEFSTDDAWYKDQENRKPIKNTGWWIINEGRAKGKILGGNLCTFNLLQGTEYMPKFDEDIIFFAEDDDFGGNMGDVEFDRNLQSVIHQAGSNKIKGLVIGRFQKGTEMTLEKLTGIIKSKKGLANIPVIANVDFGHTTPMITFPIGGTIEVTASNEQSAIGISKH